MTAKAVVAYAVGLPAYVMVKALAPNFFARGDTKTPVKYSAVVLLTNLVFAVVLMSPFGHVGIACATTIAAFVSLFMYLRGLKKRAYWQPSAHLLGKIIRIIICSGVMNVVIMLSLKLYDFYFDNWLRLTILPKSVLLAFACIMGGAAFVVSAALLRVLNLRELAASLLNRKQKI